MTTALIDTPSESQLTDGALARAAGRGDALAFEALYERHHRALLSFARHMLGRAHDAEDVVQSTFIAADRAFRGGSVPRSVRAWLYTVARNRCLSLLRARRADHVLPDLSLPSGENLAEDVERREDLRALLADLRMLPDDQRAALLLAELGELSHAEVALVLGVRERKVKALVYQARQALLAAAGARAIPCLSIREELAVSTAAGRRRRHLRDHVARCDGCRAYSRDVCAQRASLAAILPVVPTVTLREGVLACLGGGAGAKAAAGGLGAVGAKVLAVVAIGGAAAGGGTVAVTKLDAPQGEPAAAHSAPPRAAAAAPPLRPTTRRVVAAPQTPSAPAAGRPLDRRAPRAAEPGNAGAEPPAKRAGDAPGKPAGSPGRDDTRGKPAGSPGRGSAATPGRAAKPAKIPKPAKPAVTAPSNGHGKPAAKPAQDSSAANPPAGNAAANAQGKEQRAGAKPDRGAPAMDAETAPGKAAKSPADGEPAPTG